VFVVDGIFLGIYLLSQPSLLTPRELDMKSLNITLWSRRFWPSVCPIKIPVPNNSCPELTQVLLFISSDMNVPMISVDYVLHHGLYELDSILS